MKCARLQLWERSKSKRRVNFQTSSPHPRRYCQKRMVNPDHDEDPRWSDAVLERFHFDKKVEQELEDTMKYKDGNCDDRNIFLSVQNLQFQGSDEESKRLRTCFKYRAGTDSNKHRMFIKKTIENNDLLYHDNYSSHDNDYLDSYVKFILNKSDPSRPSTSMSNDQFSIMSHKNRYQQKENKAIQVDRPRFNDIPKLNMHNKNELTKLTQKTETKNLQNNYEYDDVNKDDTKITFTSSGRRKSLTISRTQSPETVQVIRVDVVCNYSSVESSVSINEDSSRRNNIMQSNKDIDAKGRVNIKDNYAKKYLLTRTVKGLDERVSGGAKVTLLCKTFHLADRSKDQANKKKNNDVSKKHVRTRTNAKL